MPVGCEGRYIEGVPTVVTLRRRTATLHAHTKMTLFQGRDTLAASPGNAKSKLSALKFSQQCSNPQHDVCSSVSLFFYFFCFLFHFYTCKSIHLYTQNAYIINLHYNIPKQHMCIESRTTKIWKSFLFKNQHHMVINKHDKPLCQYCIILWNRTCTWLIILRGDEYQHIPMKTQACKHFFFLLFVVFCFPPIHLFFHHFFFLKFGLIML